MITHGCPAAHGCFRPLSGFYRFLFDEFVGIRLIVNVSVPCRGFIGFYSAYKFSQKMTAEFPSPNGVLMFSMIHESLRGSSDSVVSVP